MQQQELAQMRQRDANLTALAAIGPRKKRKLDSVGGANTGSEVSDRAVPAEVPLTFHIDSALLLIFPRLPLVFVEASERFWS